MVAKDRQQVADSPKAEVGEIDTRAPFQSVKDAVSLFGEGPFSGERPTTRKVKPHSAERVVFAKETQLLLVQKDLHKLKEQLDNTETTKSQILQELEKAKKTVEDLNCKLATLSESKKLAVKAAEESKNHVKRLGGAVFSDLDGTPLDVESVLEQYVTAISELDAAKLELRKMRQGYDASMEAKVAAFKQAELAEDAAKSNTERASDLLKEISALQESVEQVKLATTQTRKERAEIFAEKDVQKQSYKSKLEESEKKFVALKKELNPELTESLEARLAGTVSEIEALQKDMENSKALDLASVEVVTSELDDAKGSLHKVAEEESSLKNLLESLKLELENVKKEHLELKEKERETESIVGNLHVKLHKSKLELEAWHAEESKLGAASDEMISTLQQLSLETANARQEAEEMKVKAEELKKEAESTTIMLEEAENKLRVALQEAEEAKSAEAGALDQMKILSERIMVARTSTPDSGTEITITKEEFESLSRKVEESDALTEMKVATAMAQVEAVKASENEALKRLEVTHQEIDDIKAATEEALKRAEKAEAAKKAVEGELCRWREREQKKAAEAATRILVETEISSESSPRHYRIHKQNPTEKMPEASNWEKENISTTKKSPNYSGIVHAKNQVEVGSSS